ncbi:MAG: NAD-dependent protein deacylase [Clostridiaceae bacterium]|nr:NAD-dependent protein deacylase [Clostridiaceae bacterium]
MSIDKVKQAVEIIQSSGNIVAFTGAGASTESNIPDFRSAGGLYGVGGRNRYKYPPEYMLSYTFFIDNPRDFFDYYRNNLVYRDARPNDCHKALSRLEEAGKLKAVVTQNIDGLHQAAGSKTVYELHGSIYRNYCMKCRKSFSLDYVMDQGKPVPLCDACGGIVRPDVVLYEEALDENVLASAISAVRKAEVLLVIGSSLVVYPAAGIINYYRGNKMILINKTATPYDWSADIVINGSAGAVMREITPGICDEILDEI